MTISGALGRAFGPEAESEPESLAGSARRSTRFARSGQQASQPSEPEVFATFVDRLLIKRVGEPEDMAAAVSFLLSDHASYITGIQLPVDGGRLVR